MSSENKKTKKNTMVANNLGDILDTLLEEFDTPKRKTDGRDYNKTYHKITISVSKSEKEAISQYAYENDYSSVSKLIKELLKDKGVLNN